MTWGCWVGSCQVCEALLLIHMANSCTLFKTWLRFLLKPALTSDLSPIQSITPSSNMQILEPDYLYLNPYSVI